MDVTASGRYIRQSPRKIRLVATAVRELPPTEALGKLRLTHAKAADAIADVIQSAMANATNNHQLQASSLRIRTLEVGEGPTLKRVRARSRGMANSIHKRSAHIRVVLTDEPIVEKKSSAPSVRKLRGKAAIKAKQAEVKPEVVAEAAVTEETKE